MENTDVMPLRIITTASKLYINTSGDAKDVVIWVATHGADGSIHAGPDNAPAHVIKPADGTVFFKISVEANESIRVVPGQGAIMALRLVQV